MPRYYASRPPESDWIVVCLCAEWCRTCTDYRPGFARLAEDFAGDLFVWVDVEDDADLAGDFDVENFPTLLIMRGDGIAFYGVMLPHIDQLGRLLRSLKEGPAAAPRIEPGLHDAAAFLAGQLRAGIRLAS